MPPVPNYYGSRVQARKQFEEQILKAHKGHEKANIQIDSGNLAFHSIDCSSLVEQEI